ncbi:PO11 protein, partial [Pseudoatta argentina]
MSSSSYNLIKNNVEETRSTKSVETEGRSDLSENPPRLRPGLASSKVGARVEAATSEGALSRVGSTASLGSLEGESRKRVAEFMVSSSDSEGEFSKRSRGRPALNPEHAGKFTAEARARKADKAKARKLKGDHRAIVDPEIEPSSTSVRRANKKAVELALEFDKQPICAVAAGATRELATIAKSVERSKNIRGDIVRDMWTSCTKLSAALTSVLARTSDGNLAADKDGQSDECSGSGAWAEERRRLNQELVLLRSRVAVMNRDRGKSASRGTSGKDRTPGLEGDSTMECSDLDSSTGARSPIRTRSRTATAEGTTAPPRQTLKSAKAPVRVSRPSKTAEIRRRAKADAWRELVFFLDRDPWGRPYKIVTKQFRPWAPPITETLDAQFLDDVVTALFPTSEKDIPERVGRPSGWTEELSVTGEEMVKAFARLKGRPRAPGPSGIHGRVWLVAAPIVGGRLRRLFTSCLRDGIFPRSWKTARLVLLRKEGKPAESPSAYRPICLLDDAGKLLERVIAARIVRHLSPFNSVPWGRVVGALRGHHLLPPFLVAIIEDYFRDRQLKFYDKMGLQQLRAVSCGVPQGSVLGPPPGCHVVCFANDTLVVAGGPTWEKRAVGSANVAVACVIGSIKELSLRVDKQAKLVFLSSFRTKCIPFALADDEKQRKQNSEKIYLNHHSWHCGVSGVPRLLCLIAAAILTHLGLFNLLEREEQLSNYKQVALQVPFSNNKEP